MKLNLYRYDDAQVLLEHYSYEPAGQSEFRIVLTDDHPFDINQYLLPFAIVVGICFVIMLVIVIYKCIQVLINLLHLPNIADTSKNFFLFQKHYIDSCGIRTLTIF